MAVTEGATTAPTFSDGALNFGLYDATNFYHARSTHATAGAVNDEATQSVAPQLYVASGEYRALASAYVTSDTADGKNVSTAAPMLYSGADNTFARQRTPLADGSTISNKYLAGGAPHFYVASGDYRPAASAFVTGDTSDGKNIGAASPLVYSGADTTFARQRTPLVDAGALSHKHIAAQSPQLYVASGEYRALASAFVTGDTADGKNVGTAAPILYSGADNSFARWRTPLADGSTLSNKHIAAQSPQLYVGSGDYRAVAAQSAIGDIDAAQHTLAVAKNMWNGATYDRERNSQSLGTLIASASYTTTQATGTLFSYNYRGIALFFHISAYSGTASLVLNLEALQPFTSTWWRVWYTTGYTSTGQRGHILYPGSSGSLGGSSDFTALAAVLPPVFRIRVTTTTADACTYSVTAHGMI